MFVISINGGIIPLILKVGVLALAPYILFRALKETPTVVRKISLVLFILGFLAIEIYLRLTGAVPGFTTPDLQSVTIIPKADLVENSITICDSNGINKFNRHNSLASIWPLNSEGFHSIYEFSQAVIDSQHAHGKKVIFIIGDSWTYGLNADSGYSFASLLDRTGEYTVLNAGIPGTDLPQYKGLVKQYILTGKLKPDKVVVCISRNDIYTKPERKLTPGIPLQFCTNAGAFHSYFPNGDTVVGGAKETYAFILDHFTVVGIFGEGWCSDILGKSVIISRLLGWLINAEHPLENIERVDPTETIIRQIKNDCDYANMPVSFILLPSKFAYGEDSLPKLKHVISLNNSTVPLADYPGGADDHPNNTGHYKLFVAIKDVLDNDSSRVRVSTKTP
jgi:hypothetical protein